MPHVTAGPALAPRTAPVPGGGPFEHLNPQQRAAVMHGDAPLLVLAGAGSGKTMTLAARVARLVLDGADPNRLLLLTFSRRAAQEMATRAGRLLHQALGLRATQSAPVLPGRAPSTPSARGCCANTPPRSACRRSSASSTAVTPRT